MAKRLESRSAKMPMLEIIITIGIFAVVSIVILEMFLSANTLQSRARDKSKAIVLTETIAETVKASKDFEKTVEELGMEKTVGKVVKKENGSYQISKIDESEDAKDSEVVYIAHFDDKWDTIKEEGVYSVIMVPYEEEQVQGEIITTYEIYVYRLKGYTSVMKKRDIEELYHLKFSCMQDRVEE